MGLDMYMVAVKKTDLDDPTEHNPNLDNTPKDEIMYWRKAYNIDEFFYYLYTGNDPNFNCIYQLIAESDLLDYRQFLIDYDDDEYIDLSSEMAFIARALIKIRQGYNIYYYRWY